MLVLVLVLVLVLLLLSIIIYLCIVLYSYDYLLFVMRLFVVAGKTMAAEAIGYDLGRPLKVPIMSNYQSF
jgi:hypothetical protein